MSASSPVDRIVIDTGTYVSTMMLSESTPALAVKKAFESAIVLASDASLFELSEVFARGKFARYSTKELRETLLRQVYSRSKVIEVTSTINVCRDPKDNLFLNLAIDGKASIIVTGDKDLLCLHPFRGVQIILPAEYLKRL